VSSIANLMAFNSSELKRNKLSYMMKSMFPTTNFATLEFYKCATFAIKIDFQFFYES